MFDRAAGLKVKGSELIWILVGMYNKVGKDENMGGMIGGEKERWRWLKEN